MVKRIRWGDIVSRSKQKAIDDINAVGKEGSKTGARVSGDEALDTDNRGWSKKKGYRKVADIPAWAFVVAQAKYGFSIYDPKIFKKVFRPFLTVPAAGIGNRAWKKGSVPKGRELSQSTKDKIILPWEE